MTLIYSVFRSISWYMLNQNQLWPIVFSIGCVCPAAVVLIHVGTRSPPFFLTIVTTMAIPENIRGCLFSSGKWGSIIPVTGFRSTVGANAANVGRGRSYKRKTNIYILISTEPQCSRAESIFKLSFLNHCQLIEEMYFKNILKQLCTVPMSHFFA